MKHKRSSKKEPSKMKYQAQAFSIYYQLATFYFLLI